MRARLLMAALLAAAASADIPETTLLDQGYREMYNLDFTEAHRTFHDWEGAHPDDPMGPVSDAAAYLFAEFDRLHILQSEFFVQNDSFLNRAKPAPDPMVKKEFELELARGQKLVDGKLGKAPKDRNALLAGILRIACAPTIWRSSKSAIWLLWARSREGGCWRSNCSRKIRVATTHIWRSASRTIC